MNSFESRKTIFDVPPERSNKIKPEQLSKEELNHFFENGWVLIEDLIDKNILENVKDGITKQVDELAKNLFEAGKIKSKHEDKSFFQRMTYIENEFPDASILFVKIGILPNGAHELWSNPKLLNIAEQILGPEIVGHPVWNVRVKVPEVESGVVPWHQDAAYFTEEAYNTMVLTAWIPLLDTNKFNGGMAVVDSTHKGGIVLPHYCCAGGTHYLEIEEGDIEKRFSSDWKKNIRVCDVPYGGVLLFNNMIVHKSLTNSSNKIRWSLDLRWQNPDLPNGRNDKSEGMPLMRSLRNPVKEIDWSVLKNRQKVDRKEFLDNIEGTTTEILAVDEFNTQLGGPWMKLWPIKNHNKHTVDQI